MSKKYELAVRGLDVEVVPKYVCGPWHSMMHWVYTSGGVLQGLFMSYSEALDYALRAGHRVRNMTDVLCGAAEECHRLREVDRMFLEMAFPNDTRQLGWKT